VELSPGEIPRPDGQASRFKAPPRPRVEGPTGSQGCPSPEDEEPIVDVRAIDVGRGAPHGPLLQPRRLGEACPPSVTAIGTHFGKVFKIWGYPLLTGFRPNPRKIKLKEAHGDLKV